jgi:hypothetical protein
MKTNLQINQGIRLRAGLRDISFWKNLWRADTQNIWRIAPPLHQQFDSENLWFHNIEFASQI